MRSVLLPGVVDEDAISCFKIRPVEVIQCVLPLQNAFCGDCIIPVPEKPVSYNTCRSELHGRYWKGMLSSGGHGARERFMHTAYMPI